MKKKIIAGLAGLVALAGFGLSAEAQGRPRAEQRQCMKEKGCYKANRKCHKDLRGSEIRGQKRKDAKKACKETFRACKQQCAGGPAQGPGPQPTPDPAPKSK